MIRFRRIGALGTVLIICFSVFCGCMTDEDKALARENVRTGRSLVRSYVEQFYGEKAKIQEISCLNLQKDSGPIPDFYDHPSSYVKASVRAGGEEFEVLMNVKTKEGYDNRYIGEVKRSVLPYYSSRAQLGSPRGIELHYYPELAESLYSRDCDGFAEPDTNSFEQIMTKESYQINLLFRYVETDLNFLRKQQDSFFGQDQNFGGITLGFASFRSQADYKALQETVFADSDLDGSLCEQNDRIDQIYTLEKWKSYDLETDSYRYEDPPVVNYHRFELVPLGDHITMVYDKEYYEISVEQTAAEMITESMGRMFESSDGIQYQLDIFSKEESLGEEARPSGYDNIDLYFDSFCEEKYLVSLHDGEEDWHKIGDWKRGSGFSYFFYSYEVQSDLTFGLYDTVADDDPLDE